MKSLLLLCALLALCGGLLFVPVGGRTLWARADLPRSAARLAARGLRAGWDYVAALGHRPATPAVPAHSPPPAAAKKNNFFSSRAGRDGILPQPPKEKLEKSDRAALDKLVAHGR